MTGYRSSINKNKVIRFWNALDRRWELFSLEEVKAHYHAFKDTDYNNVDDFIEVHKIVKKYRDFIEQENIMIYRNVTELYKAHTGIKLDYYLLLSEVKSIVCQHYSFIYKQRYIYNVHGNVNEYYELVIGVIDRNMTDVGRVDAIELYKMIEAVVSHLNQTMTKYRIKTEEPHVIRYTRNLYESLLKSVKLLADEQRGYREVTSEE